MKSNKLIIVTLFGVSSIALLGAGCIPTAKPDAMMESDVMMMGEDEIRTDADIVVEGDTMMKDDNTMMKEGEMKKDGAMMGATVDVMVKTDSDMMADDSAMMMKKAGTYEAYVENKLAMAETGDVVLFFHASWCPTCKAANGDITAHLDSIPSGLTILKTDYDSSTALRQKYGVTMQHTFVQVDSRGNMIKKWTGSSTLSAIVAQVK